MKVQSFIYAKGSWNAQLPDISPSKNQLLLVLGNNKEVIDSLYKKYKGCNFSGTMTSGNIYNGEHFDSTEIDTKNQDSSVVFSYLNFEKTSILIESVEFDGYDDSFSAGQSIFQKLNKPDLAGVLIFSEGLDVNGAQIAHGIDSLNEKKVPVIGGLAADNMTFRQAGVYTSNGLKSKAIVAVGFYGNSFKMATASKSGVNSFGVERKITKSDRNVLYELDGKPALDVYESFLGDQSSNLPASGLHFPIEISSNFLRQEGQLRTPINIDRNAKTITFTGEIPEGADLRLMFAQIDNLVSASESVSSECFNKVPKEKIESSEFFSLLISCAARKAVLGTDIEEEIAPMFNKTKNSESNIVGFYSYGELVTLNQKCTLVNQTMSQVIFYEE